jgi:hypothetical protein
VRYLRSFAAHAQTDQKSNCPASLQICSANITQNLFAKNAAWHVASRRAGLQFCSAINKVFTMFNFLLRVAVGAVLVACMLAYFDVLVQS